MKMVSNTFKFGVLASLFLLLIGCTTTGDPSQGGLFNWSEGKAQNRLNQYNQQAFAKRQALEDEQRIQKQASIEHDQLTIEQAKLDAQIKLQIHKNRQLMADVNQLIKKMHINDQKRNELSVKLKQLRINLVPKKVKQTNEDEQEMERKNQELVDAIKALNAN